MEVFKNYFSKTKEKEADTEEINIYTKNILEAINEKSGNLKSLVKTLTSMKVETSSVCAKVLKRSK